MDVMTGRGADLPDPLVGLGPPLVDRSHQILDEAPVLGRQRGTDLPELVDQFENRTEDVELDLMIGRVADPDRT